MKMKHGLVNQQQHIYKNSDSKDAKNLQWTSTNHQKYNIQNDLMTMQ